MELLSSEDFKDTKIDPKWSPFDYLLEVTRVEQQKLKKPNGQEKKRHDAGYLKYFFYHAPQQPQTMCKEEIMGFKQEKSLNNNNGGQKRKGKPKEEEDEEWEGVESKKSKKERRVLVGSNPNNNPTVPDLPENFKQRIFEKMGGWGLVLVIQKQIYFSDANPTASRLSMPFSQLETDQFLSKAEAENLKNVNNDIKVRLLEPSMKESDITFKRWNYKKTSSSYVMINGWNSVVKKNGLKADDIVQVWSFRAKTDLKSDLCFALVKV
ncbi:hypothetical protein PTKIN_Ptkin17bG0102000 [Pterospermum kingtungense]